VSHDVDARCRLPALQIHCEKVTTGSVRRSINCLCFSADGAWLFAGTASGDVLTINVGRKAVQVCDRHTAFEAILVQRRTATAASFCRLAAC
jgi:hypothetical protein